MGVPSAAAPPAGSVGTGQLYADAQTRQLWLGVPVGIDAAQSVLVGDIVGLQDDIDDGDATVTAYVDAQIATRAPTSHTHSISDVTGLAAALAAANALPSGCIVIWKGLIADIPGGWTLCNGSNGTPDFRDKFLVGAGGTYTQLSTGGAVTKTGSTGLAGAHSHGGLTGDTTLVISQIPSHSHSVSDPGHGHSGVTDVQGSHAHTVPAGLTTGGASFVNSASTLNNAAKSTDAAGAHQHNVAVYGAVTGIAIVANGGGGPHNHSISSVADHQHTISVNVLPPYFVVAYIMKV